MNEKCYKRILTDNGDAFDFHDGADEDVEYEYDSNGNMTVDLNRGIKESTRQAATRRSGRTTCGTWTRWS